MLGLHLLWAVEATEDIKVILYEDQSGGNE